MCFRGRFMICLDHQLQPSLPANARRLLSAPREALCSDSFTVDHDGASFDRPPVKPRKLNFKGSVYHDGGSESESMPLSVKGSEPVVEGQNSRLAQRVRLGPYTSKSVDEHFTISGTKLVAFFPDSPSMLYSLYKYAFLSCPRLSKRLV